MAQTRLFCRCTRSLSSINFKLPNSHASIPTYSDSAAFVDPDQDFGQIIFKPKQIYIPRELNAGNAETLIAKKQKPKTDILQEYKIDPLKEYKNVRMLSHFVTEIGFIKPKVQTGLSVANQKKMAKAIRRARAMGLMPYTYKLKVDNNSRFQRHS